MTRETITHYDSPSPSTTDEMLQWREFGLSVGREIRLRKGKASRRQSRSKLRGELQRLMKDAAARPEVDRSRWILAPQAARGLGHCASRDSPSLQRSVPALASPL